MERFDPARLDRNGEGEYRLNGARCRLVDVLEVLSDTGLGKEMHSVVSQGRVEAIVTSKPRDRRLLIEEAAGLGKHRKRRRRAQLKLERTQDNLDRALDVEREARSRLRPLKRQAEAAELHARLERQSTEARWDLVRDAVRARREELAQAESAAGAARKVRGEAEAALAEVAARREAAEEAMSHQTEQREAIARRVERARSAADRIELRLERTGENGEALAERVERRARQLEVLRAQAAEDQPDESGWHASKRSRPSWPSWTASGRAFWSASWRRWKRHGSRGRARHRSPSGRGRQARRAGRGRSGVRARSHRAPGRRDVRGGRAAQGRRAWAPSWRAATSSCGPMAPPARRRCSRALRRDRWPTTSRSRRAASSRLRRRWAAGWTRRSRRTWRARATCWTAPAAVARWSPTSDAPGAAAARRRHRLRGRGAWPTWSAVPAALALARRLLANTWLVESLDALPPRVPRRRGHALRARVVRPHARAAPGDRGRIRPRAGRAQPARDPDRRVRSRRSSPSRRRCTGWRRRRRGGRGRFEPRRSRSRAPRGRTGVRRRQGGRAPGRPGSSSSAARRPSRASRRCAAHRSRASWRGASRAERCRERARERAERIVFLEGRLAPTASSCRRWSGSRRPCRLRWKPSATGSRRWRPSSPPTAPRARASRPQLRACAQQEAEIQQGLHEHSEVVTRTEVARAAGARPGGRRHARARGAGPELGLPAEPAARAAGPRGDRGAASPGSSGCERRREQLGPVNPLAKAEYDEAVAHVEELETQRTDLETALRELRAFIRDTDQADPRDLRADLHRGGANFEQLAARLFPGGRGRLRLVREDSGPRPVLGGAEGRRRRRTRSRRGRRGSRRRSRGAGRKAGSTPKTTSASRSDHAAGKSMKRLTLLSGGEKSMTAIAFLFSVFLAKPCPFYILDEVEAALDDINITRFLDLRHGLRRPRAVHRRHPPEAHHGSRRHALRRSMGDDGVSKVISRHLPREDAAEPGQARRAQRR